MGGKSDRGDDKGDKSDQNDKGDKADRGDDKGDKSNDKKDKGKGDPGEATGGLLLMPVGVVGSATVWVRSRDRRRLPPRWLRQRRRAR